MQAAEAKRQKKKKQDAEDDAREEGEMSIKGKGGGGDGGAPTASRKNRKASFALEGGDATVVVNATQGGGASFTTKGSRVGCVLLHDLETYVCHAKMQVGVPFYLCSM
jgi:hypothetical protein